MEDAAPSQTVAPGVISPVCRCGSPLRRHLAPPLPDQVLPELLGVVAEHSAAMSNLHRTVHYVGVGHLDPFGVQGLASRCDANHLVAIG